MRAIQITQFGKPEDVVRVVDLPEPPAPGAGEVKVAVEFAPLNLHDLLLVSGALVRLPLPLILGAEGVGRIVETGPGVDTVAVGDLVVLPLYSGAWRERLLLPADGLFRLPEGSVEQFSMLGSNPPTAGLMTRNCSSPMRGASWTGRLPLPEGARSIRSARRARPCVI